MKRVCVFRCSVVGKKDTLPLVLYWLRITFVLFFFCFVYAANAQCGGCLLLLLLRIYIKGYQSLAANDTRARVVVSDVDMRTHTHARIRSAISGTGCVCLELNGTFLINEIEFLLFNKYVSWNELLLRGGNRPDGCV